MFRKDVSRQNVGARIRLGSLKKIREVSDFDFFDFVMPNEGLSMRTRKFLSLL